MIDTGKFHQEILELGGKKPLDSSIESIVKYGESVLFLTQKNEVFKLQLGSKILIRFFSFLYFF